MQSTRGTIIISTSMIMLGDRKPTLTWLLLYLFFIIFGRFLNIVRGPVRKRVGRSDVQTNPAGFAQRVGLSGPTTENPPPRQMRPNEAGFPSQKAGFKSSIATPLHHVIVNAT